MKATNAGLQEPKRESHRIPCTSYFIAYGKKQVVFLSLVM
jgi:hypothetical protein